MKVKHVLLALALVVGAAPAFGMDLQTAKRQGLVGETPTGYIAAIGGGNGEVAGLVSEINAQRRAKYQEIAAQNRIGVDAVEQMAGKKAFENTPAGEYVRLPSGQWVKK